MAKIGKGRSGGRGMRARPKGAGRKLSSGRPSKIAAHTHEHESETTSEVRTDQDEWGGIGHNSRHAVEEVGLLPVERVAEPTTLRERLMDRDANRVRTFIAEELRPELVRLAGVSNEALYLALAKQYQVSLVVLGAVGIRREMLLKALGCDPKSKNVQLAVIKANWALPPEGDKARKSAQSRLSEYGRALEGARLKEIDPEDLPEALAEGGGIEAFANYAREHEAGETSSPRTSRAVLGGRAAARQPASRQQTRSRGHDATGRTGRTRDRQVVSSSRRDAPAPAVNVAPEPEDTEEAMDVKVKIEAPLFIEREMAKRLKLQNGEVIAIIEVDRDNSPPRLELAAFQPIPRHGYKDAEKLLDQMIDSIAS